VIRTLECPRRTDTATRAAQKAAARQQEAGYSPSITKVPIRPTPDSPLTPESIPGPDTSGRGNLLTGIAKTGDPRAAAELMRRGRGVLFVPDNVQSMSADEWANFLAGLRNDKP